MHLTTENYITATRRLPQEGNYILANQDTKNIVVYQAYNENIGAFAAEHQYLGGAHFKYDRMSWIKPSFLWMMYRCGWASKKDQERVLAIWISKEDFDNILKEAVISSFNPDYYT